MRKKNQLHSCCTTLDSAILYLEAEKAAIPQFKCLKSKKKKKPSTFHLKGSPDFYSQNSLYFEKKDFPGSNRLSLTVPQLFKSYEILEPFFSKCSAAVRPHPLKQLHYNIILRWLLSLCDGSNSFDICGSLKLRCVKCVCCCEESTEVWGQFSCLHWSPICSHSLLVLLLAVEIMHTEPDPS